MTGIQLFAFVVLPAIVVALAWAGMMIARPIFKRQLREQQESHIHGQLTSDYEQHITPHRNAAE